MDTTTLEHRARTVLIALLFISEGTTTSLNPDSTHGGEHDYTPSGPPSWHDYHHRKITQATCDSRRLAAVKEAESDLRTAKGGDQHLRTTLAWDDFIVRRYPNWSCADVADAENCHRQQVYRARTKHGVNPSNGLPLAA